MRRQETSPECCKDSRSLGAKKFGMERKNSRGCQSKKFGRDNLRKLAGQLETSARRIGVKSQTLNESQCLKFLL